MTKFTPTSSFEMKYAAHRLSVAGVDEVGVAPLAGPVVAAAVILKARNVGRLRSKNKWWYNVRDSKQLSPEQREDLALIIAEHAECFGVGSASVAEIDEMNILRARLLAMKRAIENLKVTPHLVFVDGNRRIPDIACEQQCIVSGDEKILSIACASIIAKVTRDSFLRHLHADYPQYGFDQHKGYPTQMHYLRLKQFGPCAEHRRSFGPVKLLLGKFPENSGSASSSAMPPKRI